MSTVFQIDKGSIRIDGILFPNPIYGTFSGRCSTTVLKKFSCIRTFAEQTTRTFLKLFLNYSKMLSINSGALIECFMT